MKDKYAKAGWPFKAAAQILMFISFFIILLAMYFGVWFLNFRTSNNDSTVYFESGQFKNDYFQYIWNISDMLENRRVNRINYAGDTVSPAEEDEAEYLEVYEEIDTVFNPIDYMRDYTVNLKYALYDTKGKQIYKSDGFSLTPEEVERLYGYDQIKYYSVDFAGLNLYPVGNHVVTDVKGLKIASNVNSEVTREFSLYAQSENKEIGYIYTYVDTENIVPGDDFYSHLREYELFDQWGGPVIAAGVFSLIVWLACAAYGIWSCGRKPSSQDIHLIWFDRMYIEIWLVIFGISFTAFMGFGVKFVSCIISVQWFQFIILAVVIAILYGVIDFCICSFIRRAKAHTLINNSLTIKAWHMLRHFVMDYFKPLIYDEMINKNLLRKFIFIILSFIMIDFLWFFLCLVLGAPLIILLVLMLAAELVYIIKKLKQLSDIARGVEEIAHGDLNYKIDTATMGSGVFYEFAENINNIGQGLSQAVDSEVRSERMKTELITNVSHDIKTPLTSIINYVDLLKRLDLQNDAAKEYIEILDSKSQRLKVLIEDLVEASKASSGNVTLEKNKIDFKELISQVSGTFSEKLEERRLEMILRVPEEPVHIYADGRRIYRVLDNLFNNVVKYAMTGSRVYIELEREGKNAHFTMKNVSEAPLNISAQELTERFVRGDVARSTEGSGLGLSIAQSLVELHGGTFNIYLDGDLFKVVIELPVEDMGNAQ